MELLLKYRNLFCDEESLTDDMEIVISDPNILNEVEKLQDTIIVRTGDNGLVISNSTFIKDTANFILSNREDKKRATDYVACFTIMEEIFRSDNPAEMFKEFSPVIHELYGKDPKLYISCFLKTEKEIKEFEKGL